MAQRRVWKTGPIRRCYAYGVGNGRQHLAQFWCGRHLADPIGGGTDRPNLFFADDGHLWSMGAPTVIGKLTSNDWSCIAKLG